MSTIDITKYVQESSKYINIHNDHYLNIFMIYTKSYNKHNSEIKAKQIFNRFIKLFIRLQLFVKENNWENINTINNELLHHIVIFKKIIKIDNLDKHYNLDTYTILVYLNILIKFFKLNYKNSDKPVDKNCIPIELITKNLHKILDSMNSISYLLYMIKTILSEMQREYLQKINCYNLYDPSLTVNDIDVEYHNKLVNTSYKQLESLISNKDNIGCIIFNEITDSHPIEVFFDDGKSFILCYIDNFRIRIAILDGIETIILDIGTKQFKIKKFKEGLDNSSVIIIMKQNFAEIKCILYSILSNQKSISHWLTILKLNNNNNNIDFC